MNYTSQYRKLAVNMYPYENKTHFPSQFEGNFWAAEYAGCLFDRWLNLDGIADNKNYANKELNQQGQEAWDNYKTFVDTFKKSLETNWKLEYVPIAMSQEDIEQTQESFLQGARF